MDMNKQEIRRLDVVVLVLVIGITTMLCNLVTPFLFNHIPTDKYRTARILDKIHEKGFAPEVVVFGSSRAMAAIDCNQMTKELNKEVINFSSTGQSHVESSFYYSKLPPSVKTVVQVIYPPIVAESGEKEQVPSYVLNNFLMCGYEVDDDIIRMNHLIDLSGFNKNRYLSAYESRGSIFLPALTNYLVAGDKEAASSFKFCNSYLTEKHPLYERTLEQAKERSCVGKNVRVDINVIETLNSYSLYLNQKGIKMYLVLMPNNPDKIEYTENQKSMLLEVMHKKIKNAVILNYIDTISDRTLFYDAEHMNKKGARKFTTLLDNDLLKFNNMMP